MSWVCCWPCFSRADALGCIFYWKSGTLTWKYWLPTCGGLQHKLRVDVSCWNAPWESCFCTFLLSKNQIFWTRLLIFSTRDWTRRAVEVVMLNCLWGKWTFNSWTGLRFRIWFLRSGTRLPTNTDEKQVMKHLKVHSADVLELLMSSLLICVSFKSKLHFYNSGVDTKYAKKKTCGIIKKVRNELWGSVFILRYPLQGLISL